MNTQFINWETFQNMFTTTWACEFTSIVSFMKSKPWHWHVCARMCVWVYTFSHKEDYTLHILFCILAL